MVVSGFMASALVEPNSGMYWMQKNLHLCNQRQVKIVVLEGVPVEDLLPVLLGAHGAHLIYQGPWQQECLGTSHPASDKLGRLQTWNLASADLYSWDISQLMFRMILLAQRWLTSRGWVTELMRSHQDLGVQLLLSATSQLQMFLLTTLPLDMRTYLKSTVCVNVTLATSLPLACLLETGFVTFTRGLVLVLASVKDVAPGVQKTSPQWRSVFRGLIQQCYCHPLWWHVSVQSPT